MKLVTLPLDALIPAPGNRKVDQVAELAASVQRVGFIIHPPVVQVLAEGQWQIVAGHRRIAAARLLRWTETPCLVLDVVVEPRLLRLAENVARRDLIPYELCEAVYQEKLDGRPEADIAAVLGYTVKYIKNLARVRASLIPEVWAVFMRQGRSAKLREFIRLAGRPARVQRAEVLGGAPVSEANSVSRRPTKADLRARLDGLSENDTRAGVLRYALGFGPWPEAV